MVPLKDTDLLSFGSNFSTRITASPVLFGLVAADATQYAALLLAFTTAYNAMKTARDAGNRSKSLTTAKNDAKSPFVTFARSLYGQVQMNSAVLDSDKNLLGIVVRSAPTPQPIPSEKPALDIVSVSGRTVRIRLHDSTDASRKGKPPGVKGARVFSFVGEEPPSDPALYKFEGTTTETSFVIAFPLSVAPGAKVWLTSQWFNERTLPGPACDPVSTNVQFGVSMAA